MIMCGGRHEGSLLSYGFLLEGSFGLDLLVVSTQFLSPCLVVFNVMGLLGLISNHLVSLCIISPVYGLVYAIDVCTVGYDGYYSKGISLRLIFFHDLVLYQHYSS
jgi:hypothetical protein